MLIRELRKHSGALSSAQAASMSSSGGDDASATQISSEFSASQMGTQMSDSGSEAHVSTFSISYLFFFDIYDSWVYSLLPFILLLFYR